MQGCHTIYNLYKPGNEQQGTYAQCHDEVNVEMEKCGAYEVIHFSQQRVIMKENPAYGKLNW